VAPNSMDLHLRDALDSRRSLDFAMTKVMTLRVLAFLWLLLMVQGCATRPRMADDPGSAAESCPGRFPTPFQVIAHRGASAYAPENTLPAFRKVLELGAYEAELDVQLSRDDVVIVYHDGNLATKTGVAGTVRDHSAARLRELDIGRWFDRANPDLDEKFAGTRLISLGQLFDTFGAQLYYHIEFKSAEPQLPGHTLEVIGGAGLREHVRITSFRIEQLKRSFALAPELPHTLLIRDARFLEGEADAGTASLFELQKRKIDLAAALGFDQVGIASEDLSREIVAHAADLGISVRAWRIKGDADMWHAIEMGACGMTTNWPDRLIQELDESPGHGRPRGPRRP
jgi:glycerophosphoryl diester phosphodiesterase